MTPPHQAKSLILQPLPPQRRQTAPWIAVTGGKGGVGKTLLAVNLAILMAKSGRRTLLVDLDPGLANADVHLRLAPRCTLEDLAAGDCTVEEALTEAPGGITLLAGRSGSTRLINGNPASIAGVLDSVAKASADFDVVVCDTGAGIGPAVVQAAKRAAVSLAVTTPDPAAVTDAYALCKVLKSAGAEVPQLIVNRVRSRDEAMRVASRLGTVAHKFLSTDVPLGGWVRTHSILERSIIDQRPFALYGTGPVLEDLRAITASALSALPDSSPARRRAAQPPLHSR